MRFALLKDLLLSLRNLSSSRFHHGGFDLPLGLLIGQEIDSAWLRIFVSLSTEVSRSAGQLGMEKGVSVKIADTVSLYLSQLVFR